jgi:hypothetical protein
LVTEEVAYELGKFLGDSAGFPYFEIINKEPKIIIDTYNFLLSLFDRNCIKLKIICKNKYYYRAALKKNASHPS